eukprot:9477736-Alexandrium_andersonii.AAC.1
MAPWAVRGHSYANPCHIFRLVMLPRAVLGHIASRVAVPWAIRDHIYFMAVLPWPRLGQSG